MVNIWSKFSQTVFPPTCLLCDGRSDQGQLLCSGCLGDLPRILNACLQCGIEQVASEALTQTVCGQCRREPPPVTRTFCFGLYEPPLDYLILQLKFHAQLAVAPLLAGLLAQKIRGAEPQLPLALIPVPLHPTRLAERGYNQAGELARALGHELGLPTLPNLVRRTRHTDAQSALPAKERRKNVHDAFEVVGGDVPAHVAIVDDVMTTGTTVWEMAKTLKQAGAQRVDAWIIARTPMG